MDEMMKASLTAGWGLDCDCCASHTGYKVVAEMGGARLIEMTMAPGEADKPHTHPVHHMYVIQGGDLSIVHDGKRDAVSIPSGAAPIMPAGPHQVSNVGSNEVKIIFIEPVANSVACDELDGELISPMDVCPECYEVLAEDDEWFVGKMSMKAGASDPPHSHLAHLIYVTKGTTEISMYPGLGGLKGECKKIPVSPGFSAPIPTGHHTLKNSGSEDVEIIFFEQKKYSTKKDASAPKKRKAPLRG